MRWLLFANWYFIMCYYVLALTNALTSAFYWDKTLCYWAWGLIAIAILLPCIQLRTFHAISFVSVLSIASILVAIAIIAASFISGNTTEASAGNYVPASWRVPQSDFFTGYSKASDE